MTVTGLKGAYGTQVCAASHLGEGRESRKAACMCVLIEIIMRTGG